MDKDCYNCIHKVNGGTFCGFTEEVCELYSMDHPLHLISYNRSHPEICDRWEAKKDVEDIEELPSVTPQEPKTGRWIDDKCSVCGKGTEDLISSSEWYRNEEPNFCPFCGVKLESEEE